MCFWTNAIPTMCEDFIVLEMMPTLKTWQVAPGLCFRHVDPKSIVKSHRENVLCLHGMENGGLPLIRSIAVKMSYFLRKA